MLLYFRQKGLKVGNKRHKIMFVCFACYLRYNDDKCRHKTPFFMILEIKIICLYNKKVFNPLFRHKIWNNKMVLKQLNWSLNVRWPFQNSISFPIKSNWNDIYFLYYLSYNKRLIKQFGIYRSQYNEHYNWISR